MKDSSAENRKLPAWIGSILFHTGLVFLLAFWFSLSPSPKSAPGERFAAGGIILQSHADLLRQSESAPAGSQNTEGDESVAVSEKFSNADLNVLPPLPVLAPGQNVVSPVGTESASGLTGAFEHSGSGGTSIGEGAATVRMFSVEGKGTKFMYVFDRSASMDGVPIRRAKEELIQSFHSLGEFHQFNIIFYNGEWQLWQPGRRLVFATPVEKENAARFVWSIPAEGGTRHFEPLKEAIAHRPDVIFFLTDGESSDDQTLHLQELERANSQRGHGAQINVIQFGHGGLTDPPSKSLQQLADQNHGQHQYINVTTLK